MIGYYCMRMNECDGNWAWVKASRNFIFKYQAEKDEPREVTKERTLRDEGNSQRMCCRCHRSKCQDVNVARSGEMKIENWSLHFGT